jgi:hypothetical protein
MALKLETQDTMLREQVRALLRDCCLPREPPAQMWGGSGSGEPCDVCGHPIHDAEYELIFVRPVDSTVRLHRPCYEAWEGERHQLA